MTARESASFNFIEDCRRNGFGGAAIGFRKDLKINRIHFAGKGEYVVGELFLGKRKFNLISAYIAPSITTNDFEDDVSRLLDLVTLTLTNANNSILCGDLNAKHTAWGN